MGVTASHVWINAELQMVTIQLAWTNAEFQMVMTQLAWMTAEFQMAMVLHALVLKENGLSLQRADARAQVKNTAEQEQLGTMRILAVWKTARTKLYKLAQSS